MAVVVIVNFTCREQGMYAQDALNIWANSHSTILPQSSVQRVGHISGAYVQYVFLVQEQKWDFSIPGEELGM